MLEVSWAKGVVLLMNEGCGYGAVGGGRGGGNFVGGKLACIDIAAQRGSR